MNYDQKVSDYIAQATPDQIELLENIRQLIHKSVPGVTEAIKWGFPVFAKTKDFTYFRTAKQHITLGFYNIDRIENAEQLLEGTGKNMRHIKIKTASDLDEQQLKDWFQVVSK